MKDIKFISHLRMMDEMSNKWLFQSNEEHSKGVAKLAASFAQKVGFEDWGIVLGLLHDKGKMLCGINFAYGIFFSSRDKTNCAERTYNVGIQVLFTCPRSWTNAHTVRFDVNYRLIAVNNADVVRVIIHQKTYMCSFSRTRGRGEHHSASVDADGCAVEY